MRALLENTGDITNNTANYALFKEMFARCPEHSAPASKPGPLGPVCGNPVSKTLTRSRAPTAASGWVVVADVFISGLWRIRPHPLCLPRPHE